MSDESKIKDKKTYMEKLRELLQDIPRRNQPTPEDWTKTEEILGVKLPQDYKETMSFIGLGEFRGEFTFLIPSQNPHVDLVNNNKNNLETWEEIKESFEEDSEYPPGLFPEKGGFLQFGNSSSGFGVCWRTDNPDPDKWSIVFVDIEGEYSIRDEFKMSFSEMLYKALNNDLPDGYTAYDFEEASNEPLFKAFDP